MNGSKVTRMLWLSLVQLCGCTPSATHSASQTSAAGALGSADVASQPSDDAGRATTRPGLSTTSVAGMSGGAAPSADPRDPAEAGALAPAAADVMTRAAEAGAGRDAARARTSAGARSDAESNTPDAAAGSIAGAAAGAGSEQSVDAGPKLSGKYVAMGSSYAAGPSIPDTLPGLCARSTGNYAHLVAKDLGLSLTDVSCSGATSDNIAMTPQLSSPLQISALTPDTQLITITIGGNDVSYALSLSSCGRTGTLGTSCLADGSVNREAVEGQLTAVGDKLITMLSALQKAAPNARIYLVAYPMVLPDPPVPCPPDVPMLSGDAMFLAQVGAKLQAAFVAAAKATGVRFVDAYTASRGHDACAPNDQRWIVGQATAGSTAYHPTALGMKAQADLIVAQIESGM